jgi:hypothetical protein
LISTAHKEVNYEQLAEWAGVIVDTRNALSGISASKAKIYQA